jgi:hypothetical protein
VEKSRNLRILLIYDNRDSGEPRTGVDLFARATPIGSELMTGIERQV